MKRRPAKGHRPPGRPTKFTPEVQQRILDALKGGNYRETAAQYAGIGLETFYGWMARGRAGEPGFREFAEAVEQAIAQAEIRDVLLIGEAAKKDWRAAAWRRERITPQRFGQRLNLGASAGEGPVEFTLKVGGAKERAAEDEGE